MNQILSMNGGMGTPNNGNNNFYGNYDEPKGNGSFSTETVVKIFAITLIAFGAIMIILSIVNLVTADRGPKVDWPKFEAQLLDNNEVIIMISHNQIIQGVTYKWNSNGIETSVPSDQSKNMKVLVQIPTGDNILNLTVIDVNGEKSDYSKLFTGKVLEDTTPPDISISRLGTKLNIVAKTTTNTPIAYLTYQWEGSEETRVDATYDKSMIEFQIPVEPGSKKIIVNAVKENGISNTRTSIVNAVYEPEINVTKENGFLKVEVKQESGIKSVKINYNGKQIGLPGDYFGKDKTSVQFTLRLKDGTNKLQIEAVSMDDAKAIVEKEY